MINDIFGLKANGGDQESALSKEELKIEYPMNIDELLEQFANQFEQQNGRRPSNEELNQIRADIDEKKEQEEVLLNRYFENISLDEMNDELPLGVLRAGEAANFIRVLRQKRRNYPFIVNGSRLMMNDFIHEFARQSLHEEIPGFKRTRFIKLKLERFASQFMMIGKIEDQIRRLVDAIEADDKNKKYEDRHCH